MLHFPNTTSVQLFNGEHVRPTSILLLIFYVSVSFLFQRCSNDNPASPPDTPCNDITICDTCDTFDSLTHEDSVHQVYPWSIYDVSLLRRTPDSKYYFGKCRYDWRDGNNFRYNPSTGKIDILKIDSTQVYWLGVTGVEISPDGKSVLTNNPGGAIFIINVESLSSHRLTTASKFPSWSLDGERIYFYKSQGTWSMKTDGSDVRSIVNGLTIPRQFADSTILGVQSDGFYMYDMRNDSKVKCSFSIPNEHQKFGPGTWDLSPDRTRALADISDKRQETPELRDEYGYYGDGGVYLFDFRTNTARRILPWQYWGPAFEPRWASNSTFYATYACRKEKAAMVYEFDLNGKTLRQVTFKEQRFYP
jgi:hypothetical protein